MVTAYRIPLIANPQRLSVQLNGTVYNLRTNWCTPAHCWVLDIADVDFNPLINGIALVPGDDLIAQYTDHDIGGGLFYVTKENSSPTFPGLGVTEFLYYLPHASV